MKQNTIRDFLEDSISTAKDELTEPLEEIMRKLMELDDGHFTYSRLYIAAEMEELLKKIG